MLYDNFTGMACMTVVSTYVYTIILLLLTLYYCYLLLLGLGVVDSLLL